MLHCFQWFQLDNQIYKERFIMKKMISFMLAFVMLISLSMTAFAADTCYGIADVRAEMNNYIKDTQLPAEIENFTVSLRDDIDLSQYTDAEIEALLQEDVNTMKDVLSNSEIMLTVKSQSRLTNNGNSEYTAEVWAGVPSVGWCTVKQDFKAVISGGKLQSISFLGDGYMTGVSWGQYNHIRSWYERYENNTKVDINIKGNINYLFNLVNANYEATFLEELEVSGNVLVRQW